MKPAIAFFQLIKDEADQFDVNTAFVLIKALYELAPTQLFRDQLIALTGTRPRQNEDINPERKTFVVNV